MSHSVYIEFKVVKNGMILCAKSANTSKTYRCDQFHPKGIFTLPVPTNCCVFLIVPVIKSTIGQHTTRIVYYSETVDPSIPTEDTGVPNTESGKEFNCW